MSLLFYICLVMLFNFFFYFIKFSANDLCYKLMIYVYMEKGAESFLGYILSQM